MSQAAVAGAAPERPRTVRSKVLAWVLAFAFGALWSVPLARAFDFLHAATQTYAEDDSMDSYNDHLLAVLFVASYALSLLAALFIAWLCTRARPWLLLLPLLLAADTAVEVIRVKPEEVIVLIPVMLPWHPALLNLAAVTTACVVWFTEKRLAVNGR